MKSSNYLLQFLLLALLLSLSPVCSLGRQNDPPQQEPTNAVAAAPTRDALEKYLALKKQIAEGKAKITQLLLKTPTAKSDLQKKALAEIDAIKKNVAEWEGQLGGWVFDAYCEAPDGNRELTQEINRRLRTLMGEDLMGGNFQPRAVLDIVERIHATGSRNPQLMMIGCQAAYACLEFDLCQKYLKAMEEGGAKLSASYTENLVRAKQAWEVEQGYLAKDTNLPLVAVETTVGTITFELFEDQAPHAVNNFVALCESGFFVNQPFFFAKSGQVAMSGCPNGNGKGNAGYFIPDESSREDARKHCIGSLSMIHDLPGEDSSQFAISSQATPDRNGKFTVFGRVIEGMDLIFKMPNFNHEMKSAREPVRIVSTKMLQKRSHPYDVLEKVELKPAEASASTNTNPTSNLVEKKK